MVKKLLLHKHLRPSGAFLVLLPLRFRLEFIPVHAVTEMFSHGINWRESSIQIFRVNLLDPLLFIQEFTVSCFEKRTDSKFSY
ncbi:hypothetical protein SynROS8604_00426 [Synechococcus sp. ROS8604]|nr:hypothetical protein SynROS8604_00426 [Synechococcus sp. ROS8604]